MGHPQPVPGHRRPRLTTTRVLCEESLERLRVWSINSEGFYIGLMDTTYEDGWLKFHIGPHYPGLYYLIMEE